MRAILAGSLSVILAAGAVAQEAGWRPATPAHATGAGLGRPEAAAVAPASAVSTRAIALDRPLAMPARTAGAADALLQPASFSTLTGDPSRPVFRAKGAEDAHRMPAGVRLTEPPVLQVQDDLELPGATSQKQKSEELLPRPKTAPPAAGAESLAPLAPPHGFVTDNDPCACDGSDCGNSCGCCPCVPCSENLTRWWVRGEYLLWTIRKGPAPALVTTSPPGSLGTLGRPGTSVLFGGPIDYEELSGGRVTIGAWLDACQDIGIEASYFAIGSRSVNFTGVSSGSPLLARPFFNTATGAEDAELVAIPPGFGVPALSGRVTVDSTTRMWGFEANGLFNICRNCNNRLDLLAGGRYLRLDEGLQIGEILNAPPDATLGFPGGSFLVSDNFNTRNQFGGGQLGLRSEWRWGRWELDVTGKVALGATHESANINGATTITPVSGAPVTSSGGLLAQPSNSGHFEHDKFAVVPEVGLNVGYQITPQLRAFVGYNFLYWSNVVRPGDLIDRGVNPAQLPSLGGPGVAANRPASVFKDTDFWAHGVNFGLEFKF